MKYINKMVLVVVIVLSLSAGIVKVLKMQQEVGFFEAAGLSLDLLIPLGLMQIVGGLLLVLPKYRKLGGLLVALGFFASVVVIYLTGQLGFAAISILPVIAAGWLATKNWQADMTTTD